MGTIVLCATFNAFDFKRNKYQRNYLCKCCFYWCNNVLDCSDECHVMYLITVSVKMYWVEWNRTVHNQYVIKNVTQLKDKCTASDTCVCNTEWTGGLWCSNLLDKFVNKGL